MICLKSIIVVIKLARCLCWIWHFYAPINSFPRTLDVIIIIIIILYTFSIITNFTENEHQQTKCKCSSYCLVLPALFISQKRKYSFSINCRFLSNWKPSELSQDNRRPTSASGHQNYVFFCVFFLLGFLLRVSLVKASS